jgi:lipoic acid synthetase
LDEFVNPGFTEKMTHIEALELRETVVEGKKVKTTKLLVYL